MAAPLIARRRVIAAKQETTVGTPEALTATEAAYRVYDFQLNPTTQTEERAGQGFGLTKTARAVFGKTGQATFKMDLFGGAAVPASLTTFWNACGLKLSTATFTPESRPPEGASSGAKALTIGAYVDGLKKQIYGAMGNVIMHFPAGQACYAEYTFTGNWTAPSDVALLAYTPPTTAPLLMASAAFNVASDKLKVGEVVLDLGNVVTLREDTEAATGYHSACIVDRNITVKVDAEANLVADYDPHGDWAAGTERAVSWTVGTAGSQLAFTATKAQVIDVQPGDRNGLEVFEITYQLNAVDLSAAPGDDELSIVVA